MAFRFQPFSRRQRQLLNWWRSGSGHEHQRFVLADGAIRSGKTVAMILSSSSGARPATKVGSSSSPG